LAESKKHSATRLVRKIPSIGPIHAPLFMSLIHTPHRFRTKRRPWAFSGRALKTYTSGEFHLVAGQLKRYEKVLAIRGLNINHNHDLQNLFNGGTRAVTIKQFIHLRQERLCPVGVELLAGFAPM
jgi:Transposase IS116/IS110/IS902 family